MKEGKEKYNFQLNIGFIVFSIIFVYLTITIVVNLMKENNSVCRVEKGQIVNSDSFRGICLRDEQVVNAAGNGYINYYVGEGDKASSNGKVYLLNANPPSEIIPLITVNCVTISQFLQKTTVTVNSVRFILWMRLFRVSRQRWSVRQRYGTMKRILQAVRS